MAAPTGNDALARALADYRAGNHVKAMRALRQLLRAYPDHAETANLLGAASLAAGDARQAVEAFERAARLRPTASHNYNLGQAYATLGQWQRAKDAYDAALTQDPTHAGALAGLGTLRRQEGDRDGALDCLRRAVQLAPASPSTHYNLALALNEAGDHAAAETAARTVIGLRPDHAQAQFLLAELALRTGNWSEGWPRYEHRFRLANANARLLVPPGLQPWNGQARPGDAILLICEQGFGDTFLFIRYAEALAARGVAVDVAVPPACASIIANARGVRKVVVKPPSARAYAGWLPLGSLPLLLGSMPLPAPTLTAEPAKVEYWRDRLDALAGTRPKVGLVWAGNPNQSNDRNRSLTLARLACFAATPCHFFALQKGPAAAEPPPEGMTYTALGEHLGDFSDTAAVLSALDLLVATDTSVPNLAGAMGLPAWVLLGTPADWRWGEGESASPWYPSIRCFRQSRPGHWDDLLSRVGAELSALPH